MAQMFEREVKTGAALSVTTSNQVSNIGVLNCVGGVDGLSCVLVVTGFSGGGTKTATIQASNDGVNYVSLSVTHYPVSNQTITANGVYELSMSQDATVHRYYRISYSATAGGFTVTDTVVTFQHQS